MIGAAGRRAGGTAPFPHSSPHSLRVIAAAGALASPAMGSLPGRGDDHPTVCLGSGPARKIGTEVKGEKRQGEAAREKPGGYFA